MKFDWNKIHALGVYLGNRRVGIINRLGGDRHVFSFEQDYIDDPGRPTLSLSFKGQTGGLVTAIRPVTKRIPSFFSNLLPEGHLRTYLANHAGVNEEREFPLLAALGSDLPGAVTVRPLEMDFMSASDLVNTQDHSEQESETLMRFSLAGVQLKFSAVMEATGGLTIPADGAGGFWIVKLPSMRFPSVPQNEFVMMHLARTIGIQVPDVRLVSIKDIQGLPDIPFWTNDARPFWTGDDSPFWMGNLALAVKRFDREGNQRIHMEDFAQVFGLFPGEKYSKRSYANIASVLWAETGETSTYEFIRRLVFSIMIGNADMHLKNWSLLYPDGRNPVLSPAYDLVSTIPYLADDQLALTFGKSRSLKILTRDQVRRLADTANLPMNPVWEIVNETAEKTVKGWSLLEEKDVLTKNLKEAIARQIQSVRINED